MIKKSNKSKTRVPISKEDGQLEKLEENRINNNDNNDGLFNKDVNHPSERGSD
ncbi:hypothetical protein CM15mP5_4050 [bacterium]|nr:MAG: hypothetical protein CM15mP5_4050 [bacterium]